MDIRKADLWHEIVQYREDVEVGRGSLKELRRRRRNLLKRTREAGKDEDEMRVMILGGDKYLREGGEER